ncbi:hypothetical protein L1049_023486 [Liquidambar formosana]|uniref:Protein kinase domain-containing protein n=1 Tax=Liquidambar formosana TaxID=63359 RepID=A0AAP0S045_LIQFO
MEWVRGDTVGHGSFGTVNLAIPRRSSGHIPPLMAVKSTSVSNSASLENEREVLSKLADCPHVIRCFGGDYSSENSRELYNLFLEYASGGSLSDQLKKSGGRLPESDVRRHTRSVLKGLQYIHGNGFVHCDIKLQNILLCSDGGNDFAKIADFGLAKKANSKEGGGFGLRGTPLYMSPESVNGGENESPADIWALGCVVVEMVSGKPAWRCRPESDVSALLFRIGVGEELPEIPVELSEEGKDFLGKCFVKDPKQRWTAEMLLDHPFVVVDDDDDDDTVPLKRGYNKASTSPRCPFDFPEGPISPSPESDTWLDAELNSCFVSSSSSDCHSSAADRIRQLATDQRPDWSVSDSWVTVR